MILAYGAWGCSPLEWVGYPSLILDPSGRSSDFPPGTGANGAVGIGGAGFGRPAPRGRRVPNICTKEAPPPLV